MKNKPVLSYRIGDSLYINATYACTGKCFFCPREEQPEVRGYNLKLVSDPSAEDIIGSIDFSAPYDEAVFCGFGEPTLRLEAVKTVAAELKRRNLRTRLNTNGHGNLIHKRSIVPELAGLIDEVHVSLNASNEQDYQKVVKPPWGPETFAGVLGFIRECRAQISRTVVTAVNYPEFDETAFRKLVEEDLKLPCRVRNYNRLGDQSS